MHRRVEPPDCHTRLNIWYNPCIIRKYIHSKTAEKHVLFSIYKINPFECYVTYMTRALKPDWDVQALRGHQRNNGISTL